MVHTLPIDRRHFLQTAVAASAAVATIGIESRAPGEELATSPDRPDAAPRRVFTALKWDMVDIPGSLEDKFRSLKEIGYDGVELISPSDLDAHQVRAASNRTGLPVHGVVDMKHWDIRLSSPDVAERERGTAILEQALHDAKAFGGFSVLLVPGKVSGPSETHDDVWKRSSDEIRKVLPTASKLGVRVLVENVWNGFCKTPEQMRDYLDEIGDPWVGAYFDIGNCRKFGRSEDWIRVLGPRIVKLDCKDWGDTEGFCKIGDGDVDWPAVRKALSEIEFTGWCTAEVEGGNRDQLADVHARMKSVLDL